MKHEIKLAKSAVITTKTALENLYHNESVSLEEKWDCYEAAPYYMKNDYIYNILKDDDVDDVLAGVYEPNDHVSVAELLILFERHFEKAKDKEQKINVLKGRVLQDNVGTFVYGYNVN